jgi:hypothetical protein
MITLDEIKNLSANEKWLIYTALQEDIDVLREISHGNNVDEFETDNDLQQDVNEEEILRYIQIVDDRLASGNASVLSMEEVLSRLKAKRNAI